jgi:hypothetical protein
MAEVPIDLENTLLGQSIAELLDMLAGKSNAVIKPYNFVSYRIIAKIANLLQNKNESNLFKDFKPKVEPKNLFEWQK